MWFVKWLALPCTLVIHKSCKRGTLIAAKAYTPLPHRCSQSPHSSIMPHGFIIHGVKDALAAALGILESEQKEVVWLVPPSVHSLATTLGFLEAMRAYVKRGGVSRGIVAVSRENVDEIRMSVESGEDIRHSDAVHEVFMYVGDKQKSVSAINIGVVEYTLDTPVAAFWSEDPTYAEYLLAAFETAWERAIPAQERIEELQKEKKQR
jgi:hypothetical protein